MNVVVFYNALATRTNTTREHLEALAAHSRHRICYAPTHGELPLTFDLDRFDAAVIHYSVRLAFPGYLSASCRAALRAFRGPKLLFVQDEYDCPDITAAAINEMGVGAVFSCVLDRSRTHFYAKVDPRVEFVHVLTGYVSARLEAPGPLPRPAERRIAIGYRSRDLHYRYGKLTREKYLIGVRMQEICAARNIPHDIDCTDARRLYGDAWYRFLADCRTTLGTESGSNVIDRDGSLTAAIDRALSADRTLTFDDVFERFLAPLEQPGMVNQISPRIFEAIAFRTGMVLFEGAYSQVIQPDVHFIPLKKDFSNIDDVLRKVQDDRYLEEITERAYRDVIESGRYRYSRMVEMVDAALERMRQDRPAAAPIELHYPAALLEVTDGSWRFAGLFSAPIDARPLLPSVQSWPRRVWQHLPRSIRSLLLDAARRCSLRAWFNLLRLATQYVVHGPTRRLVHAWLVTRSLRRAVPLPVLAGDVLQLHAIAQRLVHFDPDLARLELTAQPRAGMGNADGWEGVHDAVGKVGRLEVLWHAPGPCYFEAFTAISRRAPATLIDFLRSTLDRMPQTVDLSGQDARLCA